MRHDKLLLIRMLVLVAVVATAVPAAGQGGGSPFIQIEQWSENGVVPDEATGRETMAMRLFMRAYQTRAKGAEYMGDLGDLRGRITVNGEPVEILLGPKRVSDSAESVPLVFLMAIDVSGSMGSHQSDKGRTNYNRRMSQVKRALEGFLQSVNNADVYVRLFPWTHEVPYSVGVADGDQHLEMWDGRYLPLDAEGREALLQGVNDIDTYVRVGDDRANANTALYGACLIGAREIGGHLQGNPDFRGAKPVLVVLTDGTNDSRGAKQEIRRLTVDRVAADLKQLDPPVPVYTIAFGAGSEKAQADLKAISGAVAAKTFVVPDGDAAAAKLRQVYDDVLELEGSYWFVDVDTGLSLREAGVGGMVYGIDDYQAEQINDRMLLYPSAIVPLESRHIAFTLAGVCVLLIILINVWYFTRPREQSFEEDDSRGGDIVEGEIDDEEAESSGAGVKEYLERWKEEEDT